MLNEQGEIQSLRRTIVGAWGQFLGHRLHRGTMGLLATCVIIDELNDLVIGAPGIQRSKMKAGNVIKIINKCVFFVLL